jgi:hypothetical protein
VVLSLDASRFDKHVSLELLEIEHSVYLMCNNDPEFRKLLSWQLYNSGITTQGIRYYVRGRRMSGDMNTALGNCLLMLLMCVAIMEPLRVQFDLLDDGDDCLLIVERRDLARTREVLPGGFTDCGMTIKIENVASEMEMIEWCQARPVQVGSGYRFVRDPSKVLSTALGGSKYFTSTGGRARLVNSVGLAELALNRGVPVLQEFALALIRNSGTDAVMTWQAIDSLYFRLKYELEEMHLHDLSTVRAAPITDTTRLSFFKAFGIGVDDQLAIEHALSTWQFNIDGEVELPSEFDNAHWDSSAIFTPEALSIGV